MTDLKAQETDSKPVRVERGEAPPSADWCWCPYCGHRITSHSDGFLKGCRANDETIGCPCEQTPSLLAAKDAAEQKHRQLLADHAALHEAVEAAAQRDERELNAEREAFQKQIALWQSAKAEQEQRAEAAERERDELRVDRADLRGDTMMLQQRAEAAEATLEAVTRRQLAIAGLVNGYHNDGTTLTAAETLAAIAKALGDAF